MYDSFYTFYVNICHVMYVFKKKTEFWTHSVYYKTLSVTIFFNLYSTELRFVIIYVITTLIEL